MTEGDVGVGAPRVDILGRQHCRKGKYMYDTHVHVHVQPLPQALPYMYMYVSREGQ